MCKYMFWGLKKRVKEHLVFVDQDGGNSWVQGYRRNEVNARTRLLTSEEQAVLELNLTDNVWSGWKAGSFLEGNIKAGKSSQLFCKVM